MPNLTNSTTSVPKATYVPLRVTRDLPSSGRATVKSGYIRQLSLQPGDADAVQRAFAAAGTATPGGVAAGGSFWALLRRFEGTPLAAQLPLPSAFTDVPEGDLMAFGNALVVLREEAVRRVQEATPITPTEAAIRSAATPGVQSLGSALNLLNTGVVATNAFATNTATSPIGMLNLERVEMTPAGIERGGLLATIPLAPKERTAVVQKEWSVTSREFTSVVTDSLENYSESGVTESTQLAQSTNSQITHANQFNINASASGSYGFVTASVATQFGAQDQTSQSATDSRNHAVQTTRLASSRVKQSHKMTISTTTVTGTSEATTRMLENPSTTDPIRIDYFSLMRKWHVAAYRHGLRLTYDITVPEPGAAMRETYKQIAELQSQASQGFRFPVGYAEITDQAPPPANMKNYQDLASQYGAKVPPPPKATLTQVVGGPLPNLPGDGNHGWAMGQMNFTVPDGYAISDVQLEVMLSNVGSNRPFYVLGSAQAEDLNGPKVNQTYDLTAFSGFMAGREGSQTITYFVTNCGTGSAIFTITQGRTQQAMGQWVSEVWSALYNAAQQTYYTKQQLVNAQLSALQDQLSSVDTLTLRREENDEIMKCVLRWLLGSDFEFMPQSVIDLFTAAGGDLQYGVNFTGNDVGPSSLNWNPIHQNEERINFINQAIGWDNIIYFVYSYFWDVPKSWDFVRRLQHPDKTRQAFLRAGSARVVLPVRKGWEVAWTYFVEFGSTIIPSPLPAHPYLTVAEQIAEYDNTNYPGIPPANPEGGGPTDDNALQVGTTSDATLVPSSSHVTIPVADSKNFVVGATAIIDTWDSGAQETQTITAVAAMPDTTHITVQALSQRHSPKDELPFPIVQAGGKGLLIAEWFEHTPTSGTDIAVTSNPPTVAVTSNPPTVA